MIISVVVLAVDGVAFQVFVEGYRIEEQIFSVTLGAEDTRLAQIICYLVGRFRERFKKADVSGINSVRALLPKIIPYAKQFGLIGEK